MNSHACWLYIYRCEILILKKLESHNVLFPAVSGSDSLYHWSQRSAYADSTARRPRGLLDQRRRDFASGLEAYQLSIGVAGLRQSPRCLLFSDRHDAALRTGARAWRLRLDVGYRGAQRPRLLPTAVCAGLRRWHAGHSSAFE